MKNVRNELYDLLIKEKIKELIESNSYSLFKVDNLKVESISWKDYENGEMLKIKMDDGINYFATNNLYDLVRWLACGTSIVKILDFVLSYKYK